MFIYDRIFFRAVFLAACVIAFPISAIAEIPPEKSSLSMQDRMALARKFVSRVSKSLSEVDKQIGTAYDKKNKIARLPEGENLLLNVRLPKKRLLLESSVLGLVQNGEMLVSLRDFITAAEFPIEIDPDTGNAKGWYIREKKMFALDAAGRSVTSDQGSYKLSNNVKIEDGDVMVPLEELQQWFGFTLDLNVASLEIKLESPIPLPVEEKLMRGEFQNRTTRIGPPTLPLLDEKSALIDFPFVDVSSRMEYSKEGESGEVKKNANAAVRTSNDFAHGTLTTQSSLEKEDRLTNLRVNYMQQSLDKELLGPLNARKFEIGDVNSAQLPIKDRGISGLGARVTNAHPLRSTLRPSTEIRGTTFPGWDVELYRGDQLISYQAVGDDGEYVFSNVDLFSTDNNFRVVLYGLQGEVREEEINVPVDPTRLSDMGSAYDVSLVAKNMQTYRKKEGEDPDQQTPALAATYETPLTDKTALSLGLSAEEVYKEQQIAANAGVSTVMAGALLNLDGTVDQRGEAAVELVARRELDSHQIRNEIRVATEKFDIYDAPLDMDSLSNPAIWSFTPTGEQYADVFREQLSLNGPFPLDLGDRARYNLSLGYARESDGDGRLDSIAGLSTSWKGISIGEQFKYSATGGTQEDSLNSLTTVTGNIGRNRVRLIGDYAIKPESALKRVTGVVNRRLTNTLETELGVTRVMEPALTEGRAQVNWNAGFAYLSPGVSYNTDKDMTATMNMRFGLAREPQTGKIHSFDRGITSNGGISAFVYLDKDGDNQFGEGDEPLPDVIIQAPQNSGREMTDERGYAFLNRLAAMRPTDVFVDENSLPDPIWVSGYKGASVLPREGHVSKLEFPIHMAGEMDGTVYIRDSDGTTLPLRGIPLSIRDKSGKKIMDVISEADGFYVFERIPPGDYYVTVDGKNFGKRMARPLPQEISVGYEGTSFYGKNIYLEAGQADVPVDYITDLNALNIPSEKLEGRNILVTLGSYKSQMMMGVMWFKARTVLGSLLSGLNLIEQPSASYPDNKTGEYALRFTANSNDFNEVYKTCRAIGNHGQPCSISILPQPDSVKTAAVKQ